MAIYFLILTRHALYTYFSPDDFLNLYQAWTKPAGEFLRANFLFFVPSELPRPLASAWYRIMYALFGLHPAPYKIVNLAILVANIGFAYSVARRLTKSRTAGTLTALIGCYHPEQLDLYLNTGYIFDVLCYFFFFSAAVIYLRVRDEDRYPSRPELAAICVLFICALNSKEIAVTFPVFLLLYELLYHRRKHLFSLRRLGGILATGVIALAWLAGKTLAQHSLMRQNPMYQPHFTWHQFLLTSLDFTSNLFLRPNFLTAAMLIALWSAMLALAWVSRSRAMRFAWLFLMVTPLPLAFIPPRGVSQYYIPFFGWALYAASLLNLLLDRLVQFPRSDPHRAFRNRTLAGAALVAALAAVAYRPWRYYQNWNPYAILVEAELNRSVIKQVHRLQPHLPQNARLMFLDDPLGGNQWNMTFMVHLSYHDRSIQVDRLKRPEPLSGDLASYDHVFDFRHGHFIELAAPWHRDAIPLIVIEEGRPQIFHRDWTPVDPEHPAHPGEGLIVEAADLGSTTPEIFVSGVPAAVQLDIPWDRPRAGAAVHRLDIQIPPDTPKGLSWIQIKSGGVIGPAIEFPAH